MQPKLLEMTISIRAQNMPATLWLPQDENQIEAGIAYVHGSGDGSENEVATEAARFASRGIAFLTVQKVMDDYTRSKRDYAALARDAAEASMWLRNRLSMRSVPTGLMGFSEGGWVSTLAAAKHPESIGFLVLESGAIVTPGTQIRYHRAAESKSFQIHRKIPYKLYTEFAVLMCNYSRFDSQPHLNAMTQPTYAVWGSDDHTIPIETAQETLQKSTSVPLQMRVVEGEPHYLNPEGEWLDDVATWVLEQSQGRKS